MRTIELLAPAKNADTGIEAICHGADAVYIGGPGYGARAAAGNSIDDIRRLCDYAHIYGARVYVTLNTILYDDELSDVERLVAQLYAAGVDALITQDLAFLSLDLPPIALHASTQMDNRTPEQAKMLEAAGYSQIVLARELSLQQIRDIHAATDLPLEAFVHGALCVSYSGRCYASQHCFGRSANRGRCAQFCRLSFDLVDADEKVIERDKHFLSLRDMNRASNIDEMLDAGISSFKIEGRLKDVAYVKNVTAYYRKAIDDAIRRQPDKYCRASLGKSSYTFEPNLSKSFNRGFTNYLLQGRTADLWNFNTPKSMGEYVGRVSRVGKRSFLLEGDATLNNGDGVVYLNDQQKLEGFRVNKVEGREIFPLQMPNIRPQMQIFRNEDRLWEALLAKNSAERKIPLRLTLSEYAEGYELSASVVMEDGDSVSSPLSQANIRLTFPMEVQPATKPQAENLCRNLSKLGGTSFRAASIALNTDGERFIPASILSEMRRTLVEQFTLLLQKTHLESRDKRRKAQTIDLRGHSFDYSSNVSNHLSREWLLCHGADDVALAFEVRSPRSGTLMTCRHCIRYALGYCRKHGEKIAPWREPLSLRLPDGREFPLQFDCKNCEMRVLMP